MNIASTKPRAALAARITRLACGPCDPDRRFVIGGATYAELYATAAGIRRCLSFSTRPDGVMLGTENRRLLMATLLAGLTGNFTVLLPHALSPRAFSRLHDLTGCRVGIGDHPDLFPPGMRVLGPEAFAEPGPGETPGGPPDPDREWVRLFTGGSTGRPQLCTKTPLSLLGEALYLAEKFGLDSGDRVVAAVPPYHIYGLLYSVLAPFAASAAVLDERPFFPGEIELAVEAHTATVLVAAPIHYRALRNSPLAHGGLRMAFSSASMLPGKDNAAFCRKTGAPIFEVYGATETGGVASRCRACGQTAFQAFAGVDWKIRNAHLLVRSDFLSPEPDRDAEGFVKVGDRARRSDAGGFLLLGRSDGIIKVAGERVDLDDVRQRIEQIPGVREAVVRALPRKDGRENTIAALVAGDIDEKLLFTRLAAKLEDHARPRLVRIVEAIPVSDTGKIDRLAVERLLRRK